jgi:hypothetical protein
VGFKGGMESLDRFEEEMPHGEIGWGRAWH